MEAALRWVRISFLYLAALVGLVALAWGLVASGSALLEHARTAPDTGRLDDATIHEVVRGGIGVVAGVFIFVVAAFRGRRAVARAVREDAVRPPAWGGDGRSSRARMLSGSLLEAHRRSDFKPLADRVWRCRVAVDLQNRRLMEEVIGPEAGIDAELYAVALRNLLRGVEVAAAATASRRIGAAMDAFVEALSPGTPLVESLERLDDFSGEIADLTLKRRHREPAQAGSAPTEIESNGQGTFLHVGKIVLDLERATGLAERLANVALDELARLGRREVAMGPPDSVESMRQG